MDTYVYLKDMNFYAYHGVMPQENTIGNQFTINLKLKTNICKAAQTDDVAYALNYAEVFRSVSREMAIPSHLLEHVAMRIVRCLFEEYPQISHISLRLAKRNPPMNADLVEAGVEITTERDDFMSLNI